MKKTATVAIKQPEAVEGPVIDERTTYDLMRSVAAGALSGGLTFVRAKMGDAEYARALSEMRPRLREPIVRVLGPPRHPHAMNDQRAPRPNDLPAPMAIMRPPTAETVSGPPAEPSKYLDEKQLCSELNISSVTATKWRGKAEGPPFVRVGRLIRYPRASFDAWLVSRTVGAPRPK